MEPLAPDPDVKGCPVTRCLSVIGGKWKPVILFCIANGVDRFGAMQRSVPGITKQMLTKQLRELEGDGLISRKVFAQVPPRVDYSLTDVGRTVLPIIEQMEAWGKANMK
ncbi:winged helix-turn-helix transcriptional regulator [Tateyamaria sp. SN6-1]|uniref:winged helix-turn-helix transcriptional regulator n=1 Tax=Tateyamaria sp. SN6-1 TaxID=3092148 RepID=UPI0039F49FFD